jgi:hypothetical protein
VDIVEFLRKEMIALYGDGMETFLPDFVSVASSIRFGGFFEHLEQIDPFFVLEKLGEAPGCMRAEIAHDFGEILVPVRRYYIVSVVQHNNKTVKVEGFVRDAILEAVNHYVKAGDCSEYIFPFDNRRRDEIAVDIRDNFPATHERFPWFVIQERNSFTAWFGGAPSRPGLFRSRAPSQLGFLHSPLSWQGAPLP